MMKVMALLLLLGLVINLNQSHPSSQRRYLKQKIITEQNSSEEFLDNKGGIEAALGANKLVKPSPTGSSYNVFKMWKKNHLHLVKKNQIELLKNSTKAVVGKFSEILKQHSISQRKNQTIFSLPKDDISVNLTKLKSLLLSSNESLLHHQATYLTLVRNLTDEISHQLGVILTKQAALNSGHKNVSLQLDSITPWCSKEDVILDRGVTRIPRFRPIVKCNGRKTTCRKSGKPACTEVRFNEDVLVLKGYSPAPRKRPVYQHEKEEIVKDCICSA